MNMSLAIPHPTTLAMFQPMMTSDINLYGNTKKKMIPRKKPVPRKTASQISPKISGKESTSLDSLLDKQKQLQIMREKHKQKRNCRRNTLNFRKISVITETDEEDEDEDGENGNMDNLRKQFTTQLSSPICTIHEEEVHPNDNDNSSNSSNSSGSERKKKGVMTMINEWIRNHSLKRRKQKQTQQTK